MISITLDIFEIGTFLFYVEDLISSFDHIDEMEYEINLPEENLIKVLEVAFANDYEAINEFLTA